MKYRELLAPGSLARAPLPDGPVRQFDGDAPYVLTTEAASDLAKLVQSHLQSETPTGAPPVLLVGPLGSGKTHLLTKLTQVLAGASPPCDTGAPPGPTALEHSLRSFAGRFRAIRASFAPTPDLSFRDHVLTQLNQGLAQLGVDFIFSLSTAPSDEPAQWSAMMAAFHGIFPDLGLLLALDDGLDALRFLSQPTREEQLNFLHGLVTATHTHRLHLVATSPEVWPASLGAHERTLWTEIPVPAIDVRLFTRTRLTCKTAEQRAWVETHLAKFTPSYGQRPEQLADVIDLFPLHPDCLPLVQTQALAPCGRPLQLLAAALAQRWDDDLGEDEPGFIAPDHFWPVWRSQALPPQAHEISAVIDFVERLEARFERDPGAIAYPALARRILRGLAMRRLTGSDSYSTCGVTAEELRDSLGLFQPGLEIGDTPPATALGAHVQSTLTAVGGLSEGRLVTLRQHDLRYELHFRKFRRFSNPELFLHWANAVPFLLLMLSGGIMLGSRFSHLDRALFATTVTAHKVCAFVWLLGLPLSVIFRLKVHLANIRTLCTWGAEDVTWMIQSARGLYNRSAHIPPADRFNTGQKINSCLVVVYYFGFVATGLMMFTKGTILFPWYIHTALFFSAMGSVGGHLYLAFINPSTRIALGGIFHGWVPLKYVEHHHSLSLPSKLQTEVEPISLRTIAEEIFVSKVEIAALLGTLLLAAGGSYAFGVARLATAKSQFAQSFADVIQPSQLTTKHRIGPTAESCTKCHLYTGQIPNRNCEDCHQDVKARRTQKLGYHGTLEGDCRTCHREHHEQASPLVPFNPAKFDHTKALFQLEGKHAAAKCDDCHRQKRPPETPGIYFLGLKFQKCADCHADQHKGQFAANCETCHSPQGWTGRNLKFQHATDSGFKLAGKHADVECRQCHQPPKPSGPLGTAKFKGLAQDCAGCHAEPHRQQFPEACTYCHTPAGWGGNNLNFEHNVDANFRLVGQHTQVDCQKCHRPPQATDQLGHAQFVGLKTACADCHQSPHRGQFKQDCTSCHPAPTSWQVSAPQFVHDRDTPFQLVGKHGSVECIKCHPPSKEHGPLGSAQFTALTTQCASCHTVKHPAWYGSTCTSCHTPQGWTPKQPVFDHGRHTTFDLVGRHLVAQCSSCHNGTVVGAIDRTRTLDSTCASCHGKTEPHKGALGIDCQKCHSSVGWKGEDLLFEHNTMASFGLNADHVNVACASCHKKDVWKPLDSTCSSCHPRMVGKTVIK